jgi:hypothetical protein
LFVELALLQLFVTSKNCVIATNFKVCTLVPATRLNDIGTAAVKRGSAAGEKRENGIDDRGTRAGSDPLPV